MKRKLSLSIAGLCLLSSVVLAANTNLSVVKTSTFAPVAWDANRSNGGFGIINGSQKTMYVQVNIQQGNIAVYTTTPKGRVECKHIIQDAGSVVCPLNPNEHLSGDYDFAATIDAKGTYQIQLANN